jgi:hypothetical protein
MTCLSISQNLFQSLLLVISELFIPIQRNIAAKIKNNNLTTAKTKEKLSEFHTFCLIALHFVRKCLILQPKERSKEILHTFAATN